MCIFFTFLSCNYVNYVWCALACVQGMVCFRTQYVWRCMAKLPCSIGYIYIYLSRSWRQQSLFYLGGGMCTDTGGAGWRRVDGTDLSVLLCIVFLPKETSFNKIYYGLIFKKRPSTKYIYGLILPPGRTYAMFVISRRPPMMNVLLECNHTQGLMKPPPFKGLFHYCPAGCCLLVTPSRGRNQQICV